jgi:YD repeat-containing protein
VRDPKAKQTDYQYHPSNGQVTKITGPADDEGIRPQIRYYYAQRYAWLKASGGGYVQADTPVWVLTSEEYCRNSAASGDGCSDGPGDEVVTEYDYGPDTGPNNLWLRGKTVTSEGVTLRTCYTYDAVGNRLTETTPNANLTACP